jgi:antitoxin YefM
MADRRGVSHIRAQVSQLSRDKLKLCGTRTLRSSFNEGGETTAVIIPIGLWREIVSERETTYLLKSETMKQRLLSAARRQDGLPLEAVLEKLEI